MTTPKTACKTLLLLPLSIALALNTNAHAQELQSLYREAPNDPPAKVRAQDDPAARSAARRIVGGPYVSVQVNVDANGMNIVGDAANEPSLTVSATDPDNIAVGWRQFDSINSDFRQAGNAFSFDGGQNWTAPAVLTPGVFRSDPVLASLSDGRLLYQSLQETFAVETFTSTNGGVSYGPPIPSFGGDKNWLAVDATGGLGDGHAYGIWQRFFGCCGSNVLTRSIDANDSWQFPVAVDLSPTFGTLAVGPDGTLYSAGVDGTFTQDLNQFVVSRSTDAQNPAVTPSFSGERVEMGGSMVLGAGPNPGGLLGQANVMVDRSDGDTRGHVYLLASVNPPGADPLDVNIIRSTDGGDTWSAPVRVNNDAGTGWQWLAAGDVALDGRIDAIWADTRNSGQENISEIFYAWSYDGGQTWQGNEPITPAWDSFVGFPRQSKIGDYYQVVSGREDASAVYSATLNGEQDVYYVRLFPDCNDNGRSDVTDIDTGDSLDTDGSGVPDECEGISGGFVLSEPSPGIAGQVNDFAVSGAGADQAVLYYLGAPAGTTPGLGPCAGEVIELGNARLVGFARADAAGDAVLTRDVPAGLSGRTLGLQAIDLGSCALSNELLFTFD
ncbi:MAG: sialidase family protein [Pseudomonadota bacterium]